MKEYRYNNITQPNRNLLLRRDPTVDGMKTGYTEAAGYCLLATAQREFPNLGASGGAGKRRILTVVLNTTSMEARASESQKLLNWGFQAFDTVRLFDDGKPIATVPVWKGTAREAKLGRAGGAVRERAQGRGRQAADQGRAHRPAGRAARQGPARRHDQGHDRRRRAGGRGAAGRAWRRSSRPASSAAPGTRSGSGSSSTIGATRTHHDTSRDTLCYLNGEYLPLSRGEGLGARSRLRLRRRHLRGGAGLRRSKLFRFDEHMARLGAQPGQAAHRQPAQPRAVARALPEAHRRPVRARRRRRPAGLHPGDARRGDARPRHAARHRADGVHDGQPDEAGQRRAAAPGRGLRQRPRLPLGARRHQERLAARQRAGAADLGRPRRARDDHVPRRLPHRGGGLATSGSSTRARCSGRRRASTCSRASATS